MDQDQKNKLEYLKKRNQYTKNISRFIKNIDLSLCKTVSPNDASKVHARYIESFASYGDEIEFLCTLDKVKANSFDEYLNVLHSLNSNEVYLFYTALYSQFGIYAVPSILNINFNITTDMPDSVFTVVTTDLRNILIFDSDCEENSEQSIIHIRVRGLDWPKAGLYEYRLKVEDYLNELRNFYHGERQDKLYSVDDIEKIYPHLTGKFRNYEIISRELNFQDKCLSKFKQYFHELYKSTPQHIFLWYEGSNRWGLIKINSLNDFNLGFPFETSRQHLALFTSNLENRIIFDWYVDESTSRQKLNILVQGRAWSAIPLLL